MTASAAGFCTSCGQALDVGARFCVHCGAAAEAPAIETLCLACRTPVNSDAVCQGCGRRFGAHDHWLVFNSGSAAGRIFRVAEGNYTVGRDVIEPRDFGISRRHLNVFCANGTVMVQDAGSANKTYVQGRRADQPQQLNPNEEIVIATNRATFLSA